MSVGILVYMHCVVHLLADPTMLTVISGMYLSTMFGTQALLVTHALWHRRRLANVLRQLNQVDSTLVLFNNRIRNNHRASGNLRLPLPGAIGAAHAWKLITVVLSFAMIYCVYLGNSRRLSATVVCMLAAMATIKVRVLQSIFFVDQLAERLSWCNRVLGYGMNDADVGAGAMTNRSSVDANSYGCIGTENQRFDTMLSVKGAYDRLWRASDELNDCMGGAWLIIAVETLVEVVVNVYLISSALFTGAVPLGAITLSLYGVVPTLIVFVLLCVSCDRCTQQVY